jgi:hypothetical protein
MTERQMIRAMKRWKISVFHDDELDSWFAVSTTDLSYDLLSHTYLLTPSRHEGEAPESAVEDYCNARDLEWDR